MGAVGCGMLGKLSPIALAASLHAVPQNAPATSIIDEALGRGGTLVSKIFLSSFKMLFLPRTFAPARKLV